MNIFSFEELLQCIQQKDSKLLSLIADIIHFALRKYYPYLVRPFTHNMTQDTHDLLNKNHWFAISTE